MTTPLGLWSVRLLAAAFVLAAPLTATAHVLLLDPPPRNDRDDLKPPQNPGPCGNVPRTTTFVQYEPGATIDVQFKETIDHTGCFQIGFSELGDQSFKVLAQQVDTGGTKGTTYTMKVKLPDGVTCKACTLQLRQQMSGVAACPTDLDEEPIASTYYSCADIRVGDFPDAEPPTDDGEPAEGDASAPGATTDPEEDGEPAAGGSGDSSRGRRISQSPPEEGGCAMGAGGASGASFVVAVGGALVALARRRRGQR